jgi:hypothetical protein
MSEQLIRYYKRLCEEDSDIHMHLPMLRKYASECNHITEFGFRTGRSTTALLAGFPKRLITYDIDSRCLDIYQMLLKAIEKTEFSFVLADTRSVEIEETDFLFIDSLHIYSQLKKELELHAGKVNKYIGFHDTDTWGFIDEYPEHDGVGSVGLMKAINEFLSLNKNWKIDYETYLNNGLLVIKKE